MSGLTPTQRSLLERYLGNLQQWNRRVNLVATGDLGVLWRDHVEDTLSLLTVHPWRGDEVLVDIGSGAGFPAIPLKIVYPALQVTLIEARQKKAAFLRHTAGLLQLEGVDVMTERAETFGQRPANRARFEVATTRAAAAPAVALEYALPLLRPQGVVLAQVGALDLKPLALIAARLGGGSPELLPTARAGRFVLRVIKVSPTPVAYARQVGRPRKRPLR